MSALFWFNLLAAVGLVMALYTVYKKRRLTEPATWLVFYLFATSLPWLGEFIVLGLFDSYAYKPGLFQSPWAENLAGHLILNSTLWPGTAMLVTGYDIGYGGMTLISAAFLLIEYLFVKAGLYEHHWWDYYMTAVALIVFLAVTKKWFRVMNDKRYGITRFITLYLAAVVVIHLPAPLLLLAGKQYYSVGLAPDMYLSSTIFILFYQIAETMVVMYLFLLGRWYGKLLAYFIALAGHLFLAGRNILVLQDGWHIAYTLLLYALVLTLCLLMAKYTLRAGRSNR